MLVLYAVRIIESNDWIIRVKRGTRVPTNFICGYVAGISREGVMVGWSRKPLFEGFRVRVRVRVWLDGTL